MDLGNGLRRQRCGTVGEVRGEVRDHWGGWEGSACKVSLFVLAWIEGIKVSGGGGCGVFLTLQRKNKEVSYVLLLFPMLCI